MFFFKQTFILTDGTIVEVIIVLLANQSKWIMGLISFTESLSVVIYLFYLNFFILF